MEVKPKRAKGYETNCKIIWTVLILNPNPQILGKSKTFWTFMDGFQKVSS